MVVAACKDSLTDTNSSPIPSDLRYISVTDLREGKGIQTAPPTVQTGGLLPEFEIVSVRNEEGNVLDDAYMQFISIGGSTSTDIPVKPNERAVDENGNPITSVSVVNKANNGVITVAAGHNFPVGNYYFTIKVTTKSGGMEHSAVFDDAFQLYVAPLLPNIMVYSPKNQNLVYGDAESKTSAPLLPNSNPDVTFELVDHQDKLFIDPETGEISLAPSFVFSERTVLHPVVKIVSNISGEAVEFENKITTVITDVPEVMPVETIYFFYPTLYTSGKFPIGGDGFAIQTVGGIGSEIAAVFGTSTNSAGNIDIPLERPADNTAQTVLEIRPYRQTTTDPLNAWMVIPTQDLTPFQYGYQLSFNFYYKNTYVAYLEDGRTPTDLEVYISTDYTGGILQDESGNWLNGTWTKVNTNENMKVQIGSATGTDWGATTIGMPYPGNQAGADPDGRKNTLKNAASRWVSCTYEIPIDEISSTFTVAIKFASYFEGQLLNTTEIPGRGGVWFLNDFHYKAVESGN